MKKVIFDPSLWSHRTKLNKAGEEVPAYKGFDQFVKEEMGMSVKDAVVDADVQMCRQSVDWSIQGGMKSVI